jgi:hypothetical protein
MPIIGNCQNAASFPFHRAGAQDVLSPSPQILRSGRLQIAIEDYDNRIVVGAEFSLSGRILRTALARNRILATTVQRFKIRKSTGHG